MLDDLSKGKVAYQLNREINLDYVSGPNTRVLKNRREADKRIRETDVKKRRERQNKRCYAALMMTGKGAMSQGMWAASRS